MVDLRSVDQRLQEQTADQSQAYELFRTGMKRLSDRLYDNFEVTPHPSCAGLQDYGKGGMRGSLTASSGPQIDWVIDSWIGNPERGFSNHHLTVWLPPTIKVPHLGIAIGTIPQLFFFLDLVPRADLWVDTAHLDRYHAPFNEQFLAFEADPRFSRFVSQEHYIRNAISPIGLCLDAEPTPDRIEALFGACEKVMDQWIGWVKDPEPVPADEQEALGRRDETMRRTICERDPANIVAEKVLGPELTEKLVRVMWGADRS